ncbi:uncharacterized protein N7458_006345 [Penicillium daleae]|uniref:Uncharacterized protein n=1 Tax=Penicillium daleae TaxID=63821 RepID=A0AAD6C4D8_9EURO|nr:uncharacterized protein N7458_006345 [Penicillium daleae]KAJ5449896.1 hypothetical protein N7458_006345 [Penicillium daleae]
MHSRPPVVDEHTEVDSKGILWRNKQYPPPRWVKAVDTFTGPGGGAEQSLPWLLFTPYARLA